MPERLTAAPPEGAAPVRVTVQVELPAPVRDEGLQTRLLGLARGCTVTPADVLTPPALAVIVTDCVALGEPAVAVNVATAEPAATITEEGTVR